MLTNGSCSTCDAINGTYVLARTDANPAACTWEYEGPFVCDAYSAGRMHIVATVRETSGNYMWEALVYLDHTLYEALFRWSTTAKFDCSAERSLARVGGFPNKCNWNAATCTITPVS